MKAKVRTFSYWVPKNSGRKVKFWRRFFHFIS